MQSSQTDKGPSPPIAIRDLVSAVGISDVDLDDDQSGESSSLSGSTCSSTMTASSSGRDKQPMWPAPSGGNNEYLIGRQYGSLASVREGRMNLTLRGRPRGQSFEVPSHIAKYFAIQSRKSKKFTPATASGPEPVPQHPCLWNPSPALPSPHPEPPARASKDTPDNVYGRRP